MIRSTAENDKQYLVEATQKLRVIEEIALQEMLDGHTGSGKQP
jgi:hypothetical protein